LELDLFADASKGTCLLDLQRLPRAPQATLHGLADGVG
jgi:hypothetical protein